MLKNKRKKILKRIIWSFVLIFIVANIIAYFHAYKFTHFTDAKVSKTKDSPELSFGDKAKTLFFGINNPRPENKKIPTQKFETIKIQSNKQLECWSIKADSAKGTVILFHGYGGEKSSMIDKSDEFLKLGYNTLLVDFMGSGGSEGNQTTIGFKEAKEVKSCFEYVSGKPEKNIYLFGTSMGAVAIMKALKDYDLNPKGIIIECPFGTMYQTTTARFKSLGVPSFPMAGLLVFWGGVQNGFWAFSHKPVKYAKYIKCPTLLMYGELDQKVSRKEIDKIFSNLDCPKWLKAYPLAGHENYLIKYKEQWSADVKEFILASNKYHH